ncbi:RNaseIII: ribonuclease III [Lysobacter silvestris]|uniref:Ribonuclease III n=1 Tax=Solilutibacter silvestris TaxID=1645665 RepID=A0A2K1PZN5_9GAMM|nr:RNaseIII: ribonuclease III [Lysobacter silvestris]
MVNLLAAEALHARWPGADEGALTRARAELVRESALAALARTLDLGNELTLGAGEIKTGGFRRDSILADALEAIVGAVFLDGGYEAARTLALPWFEPMIDALPSPRDVGRDAKTRLQEWLQGRRRPLPLYALLEESGEEHARIFTVSCTLEDEPGLQASGQGRSRRAAEQAAAESVLARLEGSTIAK